MSDSNQNRETETTVPNSEDILETEVEAPESGTEEEAAETDEADPGTKKDPPENVPNNNQNASGGSDPSTLTTEETTTKTDLTGSVNADRTDNERAATGNGVDSAAIDGPAFGNRTNDTGGNGNSNTTTPGSANTNRVRVGEGGGGAANIEAGQAEIKKDEAIRNAFMLGSQIVELKSRIQLAYDGSRKAAASEGITNNLNTFNIQDASVWRSIINKIAGLQKKSFIVSPVAGTLYEPPDRDILPYLYPPSPDYANVGIPGKDSTGTNILEGFTLYEVARRAINCLTLLYVNAEEALVPNRVTSFQNRLIKLIRSAAENTGAGGGAVPADENIAQINEGGEEANFWEYLPVPQTDRQDAIAKLTERTIKFLEAWDGYLRENYYTGGRFLNDDAELLGYEAGHAISMLSWGVSLSAIKFETNEDQQIANYKEVMQSWKDVFRDQSIIRLQHQISALSSELDEAYYGKPENTKRKEIDLKLKIPNSELPSQAIQAVKNSIDYWHRTIHWISDRPDDSSFRKGITDWQKTMRLALIQQANNWQTLITGQQSLNAFSMESITHQLMQEVTETVQERLQENFKESIQEAGEAIKEIGREVKEAGDAAITGLTEMVKTYKFILIPAAILILVVIAGCVVYGLVANNWAATGGAGISGFITLILGKLGFNTFSKVKNDQKAEIEKKQAKIPERLEAVNQPENLVSKIKGIGQNAGQMILDAIKDGYEQMQVELAGLGRSAAVSFPLLEFFTTTFDIKSDADLITDIIWSGNERKAQLERITTAAFGTLAVFINPSKNRTAVKVQAA